MKYQSQFSFSAVQMILKGLKSGMKAVNNEDKKLQQVLFTTLSKSVSESNKRQHKGICLEINAAHLEVANVVSNAANIHFLKMRNEGKNSSEAIKDFCWIADRMDTVKAYVMYPELKCNKCGRIGDKRSMLFHNGTCGRLSCVKG